MHELSRSDPRHSATPEAPVLLEARGVDKAFRDGVWPRRRTVAVLRQAGLALHAGEVVGLVGENGSGKTTLMKVLSGALPRDAGTLLRSDRLGYCPQTPVLYEQLTCDENFDLFGSAYRMPDRDIRTARDSLYDTLAFGSWSDVPARRLSGGTRSKLNLGLALLHDPGILLLDEPYAGFDWETYQRFWDLAHSRRARGRAVLVVSHFITDADRFDRVYRMVEGRAVEQ